MHESCIYQEPFLMKVGRFLLLGLFLFCCFSLPNAAFSASSDTGSVTPPLPSQVNSNTPIFLNIPDTTTQPVLNSLIKKIGSINSRLQVIHQSEDYESFKSLQNQAQNISTTASQIITELTPRLKGYNQALDLLENIIKNTEGNTKQPELDSRHASFIKNRNDLSSKIQQATIIKLEADSQVTQIQQRLSNIQQVQLFTRMSSPFSHDFWHQAAIHSADDNYRINRLYSDFGSLFSQAWEHGWNSRFLMFGGILGAFLILFVIRPLADRILIRLTEKFIPPTRLRRSFITFWAAILCSVAAGFSASLILFSLINNDTNNFQAVSFAQNIIHQLYFCGFIIGLYRGFLAVKNPQWRLLPIGDDLASSLNLLPVIYVILLLLLGIVRYINNVSGVSVIAQQLCNGFFTCIASLLFLAIPIKLHKEWRKRLKADKEEEQKPDFIFLLLGIGLPIYCIICIFSTLIGYIHLGYSMIVWLNWVILVFSTLSLIRILLNDITNLVFDPDRWLGRKIQLLGVRPQSMEQLATIITGIITLITILLTIASVISPGNFDLKIFTQHLISTLTTQKIGNFTLSFSTLLEAIFIFFLGLYCIRVVRNWLNQRLFPKTSLDRATQNSIDTIFNYCCWVIIAIIVLSIMGVTTQNITWIISALSVGIGFGLQAIVQNFVSGLILLAERPVRIGDTIVLNGVKGTVMSIKVRATEIRLSDLSTLIVPNSQFITSSVQNSTRNRHLGYVSFKLPVITINQLEMARTLILDIMEKNKDIVDNPKPYVWIDNVTESSLSLSVVCYVSYTTNTDFIRNVILSEYLEKIATTTTNKSVEK